MHFFLELADLFPQRAHIFLAPHNSAIQLIERLFDLEPVCVVFLLVRIDVVFARNFYFAQLLHGCFLDPLGYCFEPFAIFHPDIFKLTFGLDPVVVHFVVEQLVHHLNDHFVLLLVFLSFPIFMFG